MYLKTQGLVLRVTEYRDSDAMLTVLTKEQGLMSFKARGVRSRRSQLKSACQLLCFSEFTLLERQGYTQFQRRCALRCSSRCETTLSFWHFAAILRRQQSFYRSRM